MIADRRIGYFEMDTEVINDAPEIARMIMSEVIILHAETLIWKKAIRYVAVCAAFDEQPEGVAEVPTYDIEVDGEKGVITWVKKEAAGG